MVSTQGNVKWCPQKVGEPSRPLKEKKLGIAALLRLLTCGRAYQRLGRGTKPAGWDLGVGTILKKDLQSIEVPPLSCQVNRETEHELVVRIALRFPDDVAKDGSIFVA